MEGITESAAGPAMTAARDLKWVKIGCERFGHCDRTRPARTRARASPASRNSVPNEVLFFTESSARHPRLQRSSVVLRMPSNSDNPNDLPEKEKARKIPGRKMLFTRETMLKRKFRNRNRRSRS